MDKPNKNDENCPARPVNTNFEEIFYQSPIGIFSYDKDGRLTNANDSALKIARIPKLDDVLGTNIFDNPTLASKKDDLHEKGLIKFQDTLNLIQIKEQNIYNPLKQKIIDIDWTVSVTDSGYLVQIQDITDQKKFEKRNQKLLENEQQLTSKLRHEEDKLIRINKVLYESESKYKTIIENIQDAYMRADKEGNIILASPSAARMYRFNSTQEMLGTTTHSYFKKSEDRTYAIEKLKKHGNYNNYEVEARRNDGTFFWVSQNAQYYYDDQGQIQGTETFVKDITEQKRVEESLIQNQKLLQDIINGFPSPIFVKDTEGRFLIINDKLEKLLGVKSEELKGKTDYDIITSELADYYKANDNKVLEEGKAIKH